MIRKILLKRPPIAVSGLKVAELELIWRQIILRLDQPSSVPSEILRNTIKEMVKFHPERAEQMLLSGYYLPSSEKEMREILNIFAEKNEIERIIRILKFWRQHGVDINWFLSGLASKREIFNILWSCLEERKL